jgi:hypothetical protein
MASKGVGHRVDFVFPVKFSDITRLPNDGGNSYAEMPNVGHLEKRSQIHYLGLGKRVSNVALCRWEWLRQTAEY